MDLVQFLKCLSDETRLHAMLLIFSEGELCVCELMEALQESQPKISRHLAQLRNCNLLQDTRRGQWVFYSLPANTPEWAKDILKSCSIARSETLASKLDNLRSMKNRPDCC